MCRYPCVFSYDGFRAKDVTLSAKDWPTEEFERHRGYLRAVAYRMLGSLTDADDVVQEAWLRVSRSDAASVENMRAWLTTIVARLSLDELRKRKARREDSPDAWLPEPIISHQDGLDPEQEVLLADAVGLALLVVLDTLAPAERLAFVLHDMFAVPFDEIAPIVGRSPAAARQLASRARRRVRGAPVPDADLTAQWEVVEAFLTASREGDFTALVAVLDPDVVLRVDGGLTGLSQRLQGAATVANQALLWSRVDVSARRVLVNGAAGMVAFLHGRPFSIAALTIKNGKIAEIDFITDPERIAQLDLAIVDD
jgi:RNA polymerase sigma-70 factor, ECF subfamily